MFELKRKKYEYFKNLKGQESWRGLKELKKLNIFAEHEVEWAEKAERWISEKAKKL